MINKNWEYYYDKFSNIKDDLSRNDLILNIQNEIGKNLELNCEWLINSLKDEKKKWFVASCFSNNTKLPIELFGPLIRASIYEPCPSSNRAFIEPCVKIFGYRKVNIALLEHFENGNNIEKAGAINALYWAQVPLVYKFSENLDYELENATIESQKEFLSIKDIRDRMLLLFLTEFVKNSNVEVRRSLIGSLNLEKTENSAELNKIIDEVILIARNHEDEYIRERLEIQLEDRNYLKPWWRFW